jgi:hypothetical protein
MPMMAELRRLPPRVLAALREDEGLIYGLLGSELDMPDVPPALANRNLPANVMKFIGHLPPEEQKQFLTGMAARMEEFEQKLATSPLAELASRSAEAHQAARRKRSELGIDPKELGEPLALDKAWHGLHFVLTGSADPCEDPVGKAIFGGTEIGEDLGYGPARYLTPQEVAEVASALDDLSVEAVMSRFDPVAMKDARVYPGDWSDPGNEAWIRRAFDDLRSFYDAARDQGAAVLLSIT